jgi:epoxide hydrolase
VSPRPYVVDVPDAVVEDLKQRLTNARWPDPIPDTGWEYGADIAYIRELCAYWKDQYDWREQEAKLNAYPQFISTIDGVDLHYWHVNGRGLNPFPLILLHGWPGSMFEFHHLIGPLTDPLAHEGDPADSFDVVIPALPGFGFSGHPDERGWGPSRMAAAFNELMVSELGYDSYGTQGGNWGGIVTARMGALHPGRVAGMHLNFVVGRRPEGDDSAESQAAQATRDDFRSTELAYQEIQGTKPISLAAAQADSPAGLAAWIVEKFRRWSDCNGDVESVFTKDQLLTNIMFYWAPNSIASAARIYFEDRVEPGDFTSMRIEPPVGVAVFPKEIWPSPRAWCEAQYNIQRWTEFAKGGHFAAMERPQDLLDDVRTFFRGIR